VRARPSPLPIRITVILSQPMNTASLIPCLRSNDMHGSIVTIPQAQPPSRTPRSRSTPSRPTPTSSYAKNFRNDIEDRSFETPFFDIEDEHYVKTDLCRIANVALVLMQFFAEVNEGRNVVKFAEDFWPLITAFRQTNDALRDELMSSDRFKSVIAIQELRQASKTKKAEPNPRARPKHHPS
jgi:hypothetical protein